MRERDLEQIMLDFYHRRFNILVCTTIIESGIDVPTANTIITSGDARIPIVFNTQVPTNPLAGGNFYWVVNNGDVYGHNVRGLSSQDGNLAAAPGSVGCAATCHTSLTLAADGAMVAQGLSLGVHIKKNSVKLIVNLASAKAEGAQLDANMLKVSTVLR